MNLLIIIFLLVIIQIIIYQFIKLTYGYYYDYNRSKIFINSDDVININKYYKNDRLIRYSRNKKKNYLRIIGFNIKPPIYDFFSYYYYWLSNDYDNSIIINYQKYRNNNEYFYSMKYNDNINIRREIINISNNNYKLIDEKYEDIMKKKEWEQDIWYYIHNKIFINELRGKQVLTDLEKRQGKEKENIYIKNEIIPDINLDKYKEIGKIYLRDIYMFICNYQKFTQNLYLRYLLLNTDDSLLIYHTENDEKYWGSGEWDKKDDFLNSIRNIQWRYDNNIKGDNVFGQILMLIREILRDNKNIKLDENTTSFMEYCDFMIHKCYEYNYYFFRQYDKNNDDDDDKEIDDYRIINRRTRISNKFEI